MKKKRKKVEEAEQAVLSATEADHQNDICEADEVQQTDAPVNDASEQTDSSFVTPENQVGDSATEAPRKKHRVGKAIAVTFLSVLGAAILACGTVLGILYYCARPVTVEIYGNVEQSVLQSHPFLSRLCTVDESYQNTPTEKIADHHVPVRFFGFIDHRIKVQIRDTAPPELDATNVTVMQGDAVRPYDFVTRCNDATSLRFYFEQGEADFETVGERTLTLCAQDMGGNVTKREVTLSVTDRSLTVNMEIGSSEEALQSAICKMLPDLQHADLGRVDLSSLGQYTVRATGENGYCFMHVTVADTVPPVFTLGSVDLLWGQTVDACESVLSYEDSTALSFAFSQAVDFKRVGTQALSVIATDRGGNQSEMPCEIVIHPFVTSATLECGITNQSMLAALLIPDIEYDPDTSVLPDGFDAMLLSVGQHTLYLKGKHNTMEIALTMQDTVPPVIEGKDVTCGIGAVISPDAFVKSCTDATEVTYSFETAPSSETEGEFTLVLIATDRGGNKTACQVKLKVVRDVIPPVISGVKNIYITVGDSVSYKKGVTARDETDGELQFTVDSSAVNTQKAGSYAVYYTAVDRAGNKTVKKAYVTVRSISLPKANEKAKEVLNVIIKPSMTPTQKAEAIYEWCSKNIKYSATANKYMDTDEYIAAAYTGLASRSGNCHTYYSICRVMLDLCDIPNMQVRRSGKILRTPHFWNLVKIDGEWYHMDTCPQYKNHYLRVFLLTDAQLAQYCANEVPGYYEFDASKYPKTP